MVVVVVKVREGEGRERVVFKLDGDAEWRVSLISGDAESQTSPTNALALLWLIWPGHIDARTVVESGLATIHVSHEHLRGKDERRIT